MQDELRETVKVTQFYANGVSGAPVDPTFTLDSTAGIQAAINYASNSNIKAVVFPSGNFKYSKLYCCYDAANNPGFNAARNGQIKLIGNGNQPQNNLTAGTILTSTTTMGDCFIISNYANDVTPWSSMEFEATNITWAANTTGFVVLSAGVVLPDFNNCKIYQSNLAGSGLYISTPIEGVLKGMQIRNSASGTPTGDAIRFNSSLLSGLFTLRDMNITGFANGIYKGTGGWQNLSIYDSEISASAYPIYIGAGTLDLLNIQGCYFESACTSFINVFPTFGLNQLTINASWFYSPGLTGSAINLQSMHGVSITGCYILDQYKTFLNIASSVSGYDGGGFVASGNTFSYDSNPTATVYYFDGVIPALLGNEYPSSVSFCNLYNTITKRPIDSRVSYSGNSYLAAGHMLETATLSTGAVAGGSVDLTNTGNVPSFVTVYNITSPTTLNLPPISLGLPHGYNMTITNDANSTMSPLVKTAVADGAATLATLAPGSSRKFVFFRDGTITGWK